MPFGYDAPPANITSSTSTMAFSRGGRQGSNAVTISLSSNKGDDHRTIELAQGQIVKIGRASRSDIRNMRATSDNALFDCPVVSRTHAELRFNPWPLSPGSEIQIADRASLHGTTVNGIRLSPHQQFNLRTGDVIKLGERVSRGDDTHDGVSLTFKRLENPPANIRSPSPAGTRRFEVPSPSDQSDYDSEIESVRSDHDMPSSAQTTPEQLKMKLGSQSQPINLDAAPLAPSNIIDLSQDADDAITFAMLPTKKSTIPESVDKDEQSLVPDSVLNYFPPALQADSQAKNHVATVEDAPAADDDDSFYPNTGLSQILNAPSDQEDNEMDGSDIDEDDFEYDHHDMDAEITEEVDFSDAGSEENSDLDEPTSLSSRRYREPSAELGGIREPEQEPLPPSKPRYDPVRSSQQSPVGETTMDQDNSTGPPRAPSGYMFVPPVFGNVMNPATDFSASSRWDIPPPPPPPAHFSDASGFNFANFVQPKTTSHAGPHEADPFFHAFQPRQPQRQSIDSYIFGTDAGAFNHFTGLDDPAMMEQQFPATRHSTMRIPNIMNEPVHPTPQAMPQEPVAPTCTGSKRKADEMETIEDTEITEPAPKKLAATADAATSPRPIAARPASRRRKTIRGAVEGFAKVAATTAVGAAAGAVGTMVFLNSSYAEQLIQWLG